MLKTIRSFSVVAHNINRAPAGTLVAHIEYYSSLSMQAISLQETQNWPAEVDCSVGGWRFFHSNGKLGRATLVLREGLCCGIRKVFRDDHAVAVVTANVSYISVYLPGLGASRTIRNSSSR